jgi:hypothetical protein
MIFIESRASARVLCFIFSLLALHIDGIQFSRKQVSVTAFGGLSPGDASRWNRKKAGLFAQTENSRSLLQMKTFEFLKSRGIVGKNATSKAESSGGGGEMGYGNSDLDSFDSQFKAGNQVAGAINEALSKYGAEEKQEKRRLKRKVLEGSLTKEEAARLDLLKAANRVARERERMSLGPIMMKTRQAFKPCNVTGTIDAVDEIFPG